MTTELKLLGGFNALAGGQPIDNLRAPAPARLLAYLALHRAKRPRRIYLAAMFWPDGSDARARRRLSHTLWVLQGALAPTNASLVQADRDTIGINPDADLVIDTELFESGIDTFDRYRSEGTGHLHTKTLAHALSLYRGDLLNDHYDEWIEPHRQRIREKYLLGLGQLIQLYKSRGEYGAALITARQLVNETPMAELAHEELMRLYWLEGRPDEAVVQHEACRSILAEELGVEPGADLTALKDRILAQRASGGSSAAGDAPPAQRSNGHEGSLFGRAEPRAQILDVIDSAFGGVGGFALVEGQAGMGKTKLLANVAEAARWRGATVAWAHYNEQVQLEAYGGLSVALSGVLVGLQLEQVLSRLDPEHARLAARVLPVLDPESSGTQGAFAVDATGDRLSPDERWQLQAALTQVLVTLGAVAPTTLVLDDLQWCDVETLEFLRLAAPRLLNSQLAVVLSYRTHEARSRPDVWNLLTDIEMRHSVSRVLLGGLATNEIAALAHSNFTGAMPSDIISRLERATGGNPLFVIETIRAIERTTTPDERSAVIDEQLGGRATVKRVMQVLLREIDCASPAVQRLVGALAVWGQPATSTTLSRLTELTLAETLDAISEGIAAEFVAEDTDASYGLRFDQLAGAARARVATQEKRALHLRAADLLAEDPLASASALAAHYREAGSWAEAARHEAAAATRAVSFHSYDAAIRFFQLALDSLAKAEQEPSVGILFAYETVLDTLGHRDDQARLLEQLRARTDISVLSTVQVQQRYAMFLANTEALDDAIRVSCSAVGFAVASRIDAAPYVVTLARVLGMAGHPSLARDHLAGLVETSGGSTGLAQAHLGLGQALIELQNPSEADAQLSTALDLFRDQEDPRGEVEALTAIAILRSQLGNTAGAFRFYHHAIHLARKEGLRPVEAMALGNLGLLEHMTGNASAALHHLGEAVDAFVGIGHQRGEARARANRAALWHAVIGDDTAAEREATLARRYFVGIGDRRHEAQCLDVLAGIRRRKRSFVQSRRLLNAAIELVQAAGDPWQEAQMLRSLAWTECDAGNYDDALAALGKAIGMAEGCGLELEYASLLALEARALQACEKPEQARDAANRSLQEPRQGSELGHLTSWWRYIVFYELGDHQAAEAELQSAHDALVALLEPFDETQREASLSTIAEHRGITEAYASRFPRTKPAILASQGDPGGEPTIDVEWTVHHPDDLWVKEKKSRRRRRVVRLLDEAHRLGAHARVEDLAEALGASLSTLKRDLASLRADGLID